MFGDDFKSLREEYYGSNKASAPDHNIPSGISTKRKKSQIPERVEERNSLHLRGEDVLTKTRSSGKRARGKKRKTIQTEIGHFTHMHKNFSASSLTETLTDCYRAPFHPTQTQSST